MKKHKQLVLEKMKNTNNRIDKINNSKKSATLFQKYNINAKSNFKKNHKFIENIKNSNFGNTKEKE